MMIFKPMKKHKNIQYRAWFFLLCVIWLSLYNVGLGESDVIQVPKKSILPNNEIKVTKTDVKYTVDFPYLQAVVPNSVAWLYQPNTSINEPVMYSDNSNYYLRRTFNDRISANGAIFMRGTQTPDFSNPVVTLYGRNCLDYSMFGSLSYYREDAYYRENPSFYLITPEGNYQLDVFAGIRTKLDDKKTWKISQKSTTGSLIDSLPGILEKSFITPKSSALPVEGDSWAILSTESYQNQGNRYVIYARKRPIEYTTKQVTYVNQLEMDRRTTLNGYVSIDDIGDFMLYAQNDPLWDNLIFEIQSSDQGRSFGDGGCGPTAVAMAIVNMVEKEELTKLGSFANSPLGFRFCSCSVNDYWCTGTHLTYQISSPDEYLRYFPLAVASFATGNNIFGIRGRTSRFGTSMLYLEDLCQIFDLSVTQTYKTTEALKFIKNENTIAIASTSGYGSPFTKTSHFLVLAGVDDDYLYVLDPLRRDDYQDLDRKDYLEIMEPGLVRIKLSNVPNCNIRPIYLLQRNTVP